MSKNVLIIIIAVIVLMFGLMGTGFFFMWKTMNNAVTQVQRQNSETADEEQVAEQEVTIGPIYKLDTMIVNLADQGGKRYLRITMELELKPNENIEINDVIKELENRMPQLRDTILMILPSKQYAEIATTPGKIALRDEIMAQLNAFLKKGQINTIYFTEFVVQ